MSMIASASFCFMCKKISSGYVEKFRSADGEEYVLKFAFDNPNHSGKMTLEWGKKSSKFIEASCYNESDILLAKKSSYVKDGVRATMSAIPANSRLVVVNVVPRVPLLKESAKPDDKGLPKEPETEERWKQLSADMADLLQTGYLSDVVLTIGTEEVEAHSLILSIRSPVFAEMLQSRKEDLENQRNVIEIPHISMEVLQELLNFVYTGTIRIKDSEMARNLYLAAEEYEIKDLRSICSAMLRSVDLNSVLDTLSFAHRFGDKELKEVALDFLSRNYPQVKKLQRWKDFVIEFPRLTIEELSFVINKRI